MIFHTKICMKIGGKTLPIRFDDVGGFIRFITELDI